MAIPERHSWRGLAPASPASRLTLSGEGRARMRANFARDVRAGLGSARKSLPCAWLYDRRGSELFEQICALPEYYLTRAEHEILERRADEILEPLPLGSLLVELGSGSARKTRVLIEALLRRQGRLTYVPIDISRAMLEESARALLGDYPALSIYALATEYRQGLGELRATFQGPRLVLWLGSNIGNFQPEAAIDFLGALRGDLGPEDRLLMGADLRQDRHTHELAYNDPTGVTAQFSLNLLARINRELGGNFDLARFRHRAAWVPERGCVEIHLESLVPQRVPLEVPGMDVDFAEGERLHIEDSFKHTPADLRKLAAAAGFSTERTWSDSAGRFSLRLLAPDAG